MRSTHASKTHFYLLVIGTVCYLLYSHRGFVTINNGVPELAVLDFAVMCRNTMLYLGFVVLVFGHALLCPSQPSNLTDGEKEE